MNIAITLNNAVNLFSNGINQNAIYLALLFKEMGHTVNLITDVRMKDGKDEKMIRDITKGIKKVHLRDSYTLKLDLIISFSFNLDEKHINSYKILNGNIKHVHYRCGNSALIEMESLLFSDKLHRLFDTKGLAKPDQIWSIPQMEATNLEYYQLKYDCEDATTVPFVWNPLLIEHAANILKFDNYSGRKLTRVGTVEPNLSVMKNMFIPINIVSKFIKNGNKLDGFNTFGSDQLKSNPNLVKFIEERELGNIITANGRWPIIKVLKEWVDVVLSWQWENNLNYMPLDVAWFGYPIVHNMEFLQDLGYYYPFFSINEGAKQLELAIQNHPTDKDYLNRSRELIGRYISNPELQQQYAKLLDNVINDNFEKGNYNWKTNTIY